MNILTKNPIRECDREELKHKEENHDMNRKDKGEYILHKNYTKQSSKTLRRRTRGCSNYLITLAIKTKVPFTTT